MSKQPSIDELRAQWGLSEADIKLVHILTPKKPTKSTKSKFLQAAKAPQSLNARIKLAMKNRIIEEDQDQVLLEYPFNDNRTSNDIRKACVIQSQIRHFWNWNPNKDWQIPDGQQVIDLIYPEDICPNCYRFVEVDPCPYCGTTGITLGPKVKKYIEPKKVERELGPDEHVSNIWMGNP